MINLEHGDILKYIPTSTVGKVLEIKEDDKGVTWVKLDYTGLFYDAKYLIPADPSEYIEVSFKERKSTYEGGKQTMEDIKAETEGVDISDMMPSGGG